MTADPFDSPPLEERQARLERALIDEYLTAAGRIKRRAVQHHGELLSRRCDFDDARVKLELEGIAVVEALGQFGGT